MHNREILVFLCSLLQADYAGSIPVTRSTHFSTDSSRPLVVLRFGSQPFQKPDLTAPRGERKQSSQLQANSLSHHAAKLQEILRY